MPEEKRKIPRLGKAAGEFNVSISTITALLKKKNLEIEDNPNTKLTEEMYDILLREFAGEKLVKAEADKIDIGTFNAKTKAENKPKEAKADEPEEVVEDNSLIIKKNTINTPQHIETDVPTPKVLGKINLEELSPKKKSKQQPVETPVEEPAPTPAPAPEPEPKKVPEHIPTVVEKLEQPKVIDKADLDVLLKRRKKPPKR